MWSQIRQFIQPPIFADDEKTYQATLIHVTAVILIIMLIGNIYFVYTTSPYFLTNTIIVVVLMTVFWFCLYGIKRGYIQTASLALIGVLWAATSTFLLIYGIRDTLTNGFYVVVVVAILLMGWRGGLLAITLSSLTMGLLVYGETTGLWPKSPPAPLDNILRVSIVVYFTLGTLVYSATSVIRKALDKARINGQALAASEKRLGHILTNAPVSMALANLQGKFWRVNEAMCQMLGYSEAELLDRSFADFTEPNDIRLTQQAIQKIVTGEEDRSQYEVRYVHKNGRIIWTITTIYLVCDDQNQPDYFIGQTQNITQRKEVEESLKQHQEQLEEMVAMQTAELRQEIKERKLVERELRTYRQQLEDLVQARTAELETVNEQLQHKIEEHKQDEIALRKNMALYQTLFENAHDAIWLYTLDGKVMTANTQACEFTGYSLAEMIGQSADFFTIPEEYDTADKTFQEVIVEGQDLPIYERTLVRKDGVQRIGEIRASRVEDEDGNAFLFQGVVRDVTERKQAEAKIRAALQEKEILLKEIHHRVKNNLQVISSLLDLQSDYTVDEAVKEMFQESRSRVRSMALVHEQLYQSPDLAQIDFAEYVHSLVGYLQRVYEQVNRRVNLVVDVADIPLSVETAVPLGLIINELVSNAYKHAFVDGRSGQITIQLQRDSSTQHRLLVVDNGLGIPPSIDFHHTTSLGLTIVLTLVNQLQGHIELHREQGTHIEVVFRLSHKVAKE